MPWRITLMALVSSHAPPSLLVLVSSPGKGHSGIGQVWCRWSLSSVMIFSSPREGPGARHPCGRWCTAWSAWSPWADRSPLHTGSSAARVAPPQEEERQADIRSRSDRLTSEMQTGTGGKNVRTLSRSGACSLKKMILNFLHLHLVIYQMLLSKATYKWGQ